MLYKKFFVVLCPILLFLGLELLLFRIKWLYFIIPPLFLLILFSIKFIVRIRLFSRDFFGYAVPLFLLFLSSIAVLFITSSGLVRQALVVVFCLIAGMYLESIFTYFYNSEHYQFSTFENFSVFLNFVIFFLTVIALNAFGVFLNFPLYFPSLILIIITALLMLQSFWVYKIKSGLKFIYLLILSLIILELYWSINFLPANFYVNSAILTIFYFFLWEIFIAKLNSRLEGKLVWKSAIMIFILLLLIIFTSRWI